MTGHLTNSPTLKPSAPSNTSWTVSLPAQASAELTITVVTADDRYVLKRRNTPNQSNPYCDKYVTQSGENFLWTGEIVDRGAVHSGTCQVVNTGSGIASSTIKVECTWQPVGGGSGVGVGVGSGDILGLALATATRTTGPVSWQFDRVAQVADGQSRINWTVGVYESAGNPTNVTFTGLSATNLSPAAAVWTINPQTGTGTNYLTGSVTSTNGSTGNLRVTFTGAPGSPNTAEQTLSFVAMESTTRYPAPANSDRARTKIGVAEEIFLELTPITIATNVVWSVTGGGSFLVSTGTRNRLYGPPTGSVCIVTATLNGELSCSKLFVVVPPTGFTNATITSASGPPAGMPGVHMTVDVFIGPLDVCFRDVVWIQEQYVDASNIWGCMTNWSPAILGHSTTNGFEQLGARNDWQGDRCGWWNSTVMPSPYQNGGWSWDIPVRWYAEDVGAAATGPTNAWSWIQTFSVDTNGTVSVSKYGCVEIRTTNNVITTTNLINGTMY